MPQNRRDYREFFRNRIGVLTPLNAGIDGAIAGDQPDWAQEPSNYKINDFITNACRIVNQQVGLAGDSSMRSLPIAPQTITGPLTLDMGSMPGYRDRSMISVRRAWWNDGASIVRLEPVVLSDLDRRNDPYINDPVSTPVRFAVEGNTIFLDPAPAAGGTFQFMATSGILAPNNDEQPFNGIPESYDPCILYIAIVEYGKSLPGDAEMAARAQAFTPDAAAGLERLFSWYNGGNSEEAQSSLIFDASAFRRNSRIM